ncbi:MAG: hypothetical protein AAGI88_26270 [Pseudomonadota bacterium]
MRHVALTLTLLGFLGTAVFAIVSVARNSPAFSVSLRVDSVLGDWRVPVSSALYDKGKYHFQIGYGYLRGDDLALMVGEEAELPDFETYIARMQAATGNFEISLLSLPGQADTWTALAWTRFLTEDLAGSEHALRVSWDLATHNSSEAIERIGLVLALDEVLSASWRDDAVASEAVLNDLRTLKKYDPAYLDGIREEETSLSRDVEAVVFTDAAG